MRSNTENLQARADHLARLKKIKKSIVNGPNQILSLTGLCCDISLSFFLIIGPDFPFS